MKRIIGAVLVAVLLISGFSWGCGVSVSGSGKLETREMDFSDFTGIEASHGFRVEITRSDSFSVSITADDNLWEDHIKVTRSGDTLDIGLRLNRIYNSVTLKARITMPDLYELDLSGGSRASITGFSSTHDFSAQLSGGSQISGNIEADDADFELSGGSQVDLKGSAEGLAIDGSGGSQLDLEDFVVDDADIKLSGGGKATVKVNGTLSVNLSGGSKVLYIGKPTISDIDVSGGSTISQK